MYSAEKIVKRPQYLTAKKRLALFRISKLAGPCSFLFVLTFRVVMEVVRFCFNMTHCVLLLMHHWCIVDPVDPSLIHHWSIADITCTHIFRVGWDNIQRPQSSISYRGWDYCQYCKIQWDFYSTTESYVHLDRNLKYLLLNSCITDVASCFSLCFQNWSLLLISRTVFCGPDIRSLGCFWLKYYFGRARGRGTLKTATILHEVDRSKNVSYGKERNKEMPLSTGRDQDSLPNRRRQDYCNRPVAVTTDISPAKLRRPALSSSSAFSPSTSPRTKHKEAFNTQVTKAVTVLIAQHHRCMAWTVTSFEKSPPKPSVYVCLAQFDFRSACLYIPVCTCLCQCTPMRRGYDHPFRLLQAIVHSCQERAYTPLSLPKPRDAISKWYLALAWARHVLLIL